MAKKKQKIISLIFLLAVAVITAFAAAVSVSRYVFDFNDSVTGMFTNLYFSHNGEGRAVIMEEEGNGYTGYLSFTAFNYDGDDISARDITYTVRLPSNEELAAGQVEDAWGTITLLDDAEIIEATRNYISVSFDNKTEQTSTISAIGAGETFERNENSDVLKILRGNGTGLTFGGERLYLIIEITRPYRELRPFVINASTSLVSVSTSAVHNTATHFDYPQYSVFVQTGRSFTAPFEDSALNQSVVKSSPVKVELSWTSDSMVIFDDRRLFTSTENNLIADYFPTDAQGWAAGWNVVAETSAGAHTTTVTLYLEQGSDVSMYFYVTNPDNFSCSIKAMFRTENNGVLGTAQYTYIAGASSDGLVIESGV